MQKFISALLINVHTCKQPRYQSTAAWVIKLWYNHKMENYSAIKMNKLLIYKIAWMNVKSIMLITDYILDDSIYLTFWKT